jgi:hypothetical protein
VRSNRAPYHRLELPTTAGLPQKVDVVYDCTLESLMLEQDKRTETAVPTPEISPESPRIPMDNVSSVLHTALEPLRLEQQRQAATLACILERLDRLSPSAENGAREKSCRTPRAVSFASKPEAEQASSAADSPRFDGERCSSAAAGQQDASLLETTEEPKWSASRQHLLDERKSTVHDRRRSETLQHEGKINELWAWRHLQDSDELNELISEIRSGHKKSAQAQLSESARHIKLSRRKREAKRKADRASTDASRTSRDSSSTSGKR